MNQIVLIEPYVTDNGINFEAQKFFFVHMYILCLAIISKVTDFCLKMNFLVLAILIDNKFTFPTYSKPYFFNTYVYECVCRCLTPRMWYLRRPVYSIISSRVIDVNELPDMVLVTELGTKLWSSEGAASCFYH